MIEIYLKYDNMHTFRIINAFICINNHVISCVACYQIPQRIRVILDDVLKFDQIGR